MPTGRLSKQPGRASNTFGGAIDSLPVSIVTRLGAMDIRHLRYFVAVADALSFARAARELHMSQPPLSKRIADIENELGIRLFDRSSRKVTLTAAGASLLPNARAALKVFDQVLRTARALSPTQSRHLRIALPPETSKSVLLAIVAELRREQVEVSIAEAMTAEQHRLLETGEIDIGVLRHPFETRGLRVSAPLMQPLGVLMQSSHPLAGRRVLRLRDLQPYPLVHFQRHVSPGLYDELLELCRAGGYVPKRILHGVRMTAALLATEAAVTFTTERLLKRRGQSGSKELVWKPLAGEPIHWWTSAVCRANEWDRVTRLAVGVIVEALKTQEKWVPKARPRRAGR